jgi:hypothetical protein
VVDEFVKVFAVSQRAICRRGDNTALRRRGGFFFVVPLACNTREKKKQIN